MYYPVILKPSCLLESVVILKLHVPKSHPRPLVSESLRLKLGNVRIQKTKKTEKESLLLKTNPVHKLFIIRLENYLASAIFYPYEEEFIYCLSHNF